MRARLGRIAVGLALALILAAPGVANAGIVGVAPSDSDGPNQSFLTNDALWAVGVSNIFTGAGQLCAVETTTPRASHCESDGYWGQPNAIATVGTFLQPIVAPYLPTGTYSVLADNGGDGSANVLSSPFTVSRCLGVDVDCAKDLAQADLDSWKTAAAASLDGPAAACLATTAYSVVGDKMGAAVSYAAAGASLRAYLLSIVQTGQPELEFLAPAASRDLAISVLQKVSCGAYLMYGDIIADPPDPDFKHLTEANPEGLPVTSLFQADQAALNLEQVRAEGQAQRVGVERYTGARAGGEPAWGALHAARLGVAGLRMQRAMRRSIAGLRAYAAQLDADADIQAASAQDVQKLRQIHERIRVSGFTAGELSSLQSAGLNATQVADVLVQLSQPLPPGTGGVSPADGLRAEADALEHTACGTPTSLCDFDEFARLASAVGANAAAQPTVSVADAQIVEGDRGVNQLHVQVQLSHPSESSITGRLTLAGPEAHPGVEATESFFFQAHETRAVVRVLVPGDTVPEPDETLSLAVGVDFNTALPQAQPLTITVKDNDGGSTPAAGAHGLLAFTGPGPPSTYVTEPDGTNIVRIFDDAVLQRLVVTDWSRDGDLLLMHRVPRTLGDGAGPGAPYFALPVGPDGHTTGGAPTQLTPAGEWHVGARFSPDRRRLVSSLITEPQIKLVVRKLSATGAPEGQAHLLGEDPMFSGWERQASADWSPDGARLVFDGCKAQFNPCGIYTLPVDAEGVATGPPVPVLTDAGTRVANTATERFEAPSWSPDGRFISFIHTTDLFTSTEQVLLERVPVDGTGQPTGAPAVLSSGLAPVGGFYEASPDWAPDSRGIAFSAKVHPLTGLGDPVDVVVKLDANGLPAGQPVPLAPVLLSPHGWRPNPPVWGPLPTAPPVPPVAEPPVVIPPTGQPAGGAEGAAKQSPASVDAPRVAPASAASLPSNKRCISRRSFKIRLAKPAGDPLAKAEVRVNGRKVQVIKKSRLTAPVDLRGLPKGSVKVSITAITRSGRRLTASRTYKTCAVRKRR